MIHQYVEQALYKNDDDEDEDEETMKDKILPNHEKKEQELDPFDDLEAFLRPPKKENDKKQQKKQRIGMILSQSNSNSNKHGIEVLLRYDRIMTVFFYFF